jgi:hypothetical protein
VKAAVLISVFLIFMAVVALKVLKWFFPELWPDKPEDSSVKPLKPETPESNDDWFKETELTHRRSPRRLSFSGTMILVAAFAFLVYTNIDLIKETKLYKRLNSDLNSNLTSKSGEPEKPVIEAKTLRITGEKKVDGVVWFQLTGTNSNGEKVQGWFTEYALKQKPPEEAKMINSLSEKLGLPTMEERVEYYKKLKNINSSLNQALKPEKEID